MEEIKMKDIPEIRMYKDKRIYFIDISFDVFEEFGKSIITLAWIHNFYDVAIFDFFKVIRFEFKEIKDAKIFKKKILNLLIETRD